MPYSTSCSLASGSERFPLTEIPLNIESTFVDGFDSAKLNPNDIYEATEAIHTLPVSETTMDIVVPGEQNFRLLSC